MICSIDRSIIELSMSAESNDFGNNHLNEKPEVSNKKISVGNIIGRISKA